MTQPFCSESPLVSIPGPTSVASEWPLAAEQLCSRPVPSENREELTTCKIITLLNLWSTPLSLLQIQVLEWWCHVLSAFLNLHGLFFLSTELSNLYFSLDLSGTNIGLHGLRDDESSILVRGSTVHVKDYVMFVCHTVFFLSCCFKTHRHKLFFYMLKHLGLIHVFTETSDINKNKKETSPATQKSWKVTKAPKSYRKCIFKSSQADILTCCSNRS